MGNCVLTYGLTLDSCNNNIPGVEALWALTTTGSSISVSGLTYDVSSEELTSFDANATGVFKKIDLVRNSNAVLSEEVNVNAQSLSFTFVPSLQFQIPGWAQEYTLLYQEIVKSTESYFIVKLKSGKYFLAAPSGMYISAATVASGSQPGDDQLYDITVTGNETRSLPEMTVTTDLATYFSGTNITVDRE
jgi:hypothetical protein